MRLLDHLVRAGDVCFRGRSYLPLILLPAFLLSLAATAMPYHAGPWGRAWGAWCLGLSLAGLGLRIWTIGTAAAGTSERSTTVPRAAELSTTGVYSVVRHPLYIGNTIVALGLACFTRTWYLPVIVVLASLLYHERICAREEEFLEQRFGEAFTAWAARVPAMIPVGVAYRPANLPFRWRRVIGREVHGLLAISASFFVLDTLHDSVVAGRLSFDAFWTSLFGVTAALFAVVVGLKRGFGFFR